MNKNVIKNAIESNRRRLLSPQQNQQKYPTITKMVKNFGNDVLKNVKSVAAGNPLTSDDIEANRRKSICNKCEFFNKNQERCTKCGCFMAVKVYLKASSCPIGKW